MRAVGRSAILQAGLAVFAISGILFQGAGAADLYWSGTGTWDTTAQNWGSSPGGPYTGSTWSNATPDSATFEGTGGTVTLAESITAGTLAFGNGSGTYTLVGDADTATLRSLSVGSLTTGSGSTVKLGNGGTTAGTVSPVLVLAGDVTNGGTLQFAGARIASDSTTDRTISGLVENLGGGGNALLGDAANNGKLIFTGEMRFGLPGLGFTTTSDVDLTGPVTGSGGFSKAGAGVLTLTGTNTFSGATTIAAGTVTLGVAQDGTTSGPLGTTGTISLTGGTLRYTAANTHDYSARFSTAANQQYRVDTNGQDVNWASPLTSSGGRLIKTGAGTLTINATNTASGNVEIAGGTVVVPAGRTLAFSGATKANNDALVISGGAALEISDWGGWGANGPLGQLNYNTGYLTVSGGTIRMAATASANRGVWLGANGTTLESAAGVTWTIASGVNTLTGTGALTLAGAGDGAIATTINSTGSLVKTDGGTWTLTSTKSNGGNTTVSGGTLVIGAGGRLYDGGYQSAAVLTVGSGATLDLQSWAYGATSQSLGGLRAATNAVVVNGGTIRISGSTPTAYGRGVTVQSGGIRLEAAAGADWTLNTADGAANNWSFSGNPSVTLAGDGTGSLGKVLALGSGGLTKAGSGTWTLAVANTFTGLATISGGTLAIGAGGSLFNTGGFFGTPGTEYVSVEAGATLATRNWDYGNGNALNQLRNNYYTVGVDGGTIQFTETSSSVRAFTVRSGGVELVADAGVSYTKLAGTVGNQNIIFGDTAGSLTLAGDGVGEIQDDLGTYGTWSAGAGIIKNGTGTWTLSGGNTLQGGTSINAGTLIAGSANALGTSGSITIGASGTLGVAAGVAFSRPLTITAGGKVSLGDGASVALPDAAALSTFESTSTAGAATTAEILFGSGSTTPSSLTSGWLAQPAGSFSDILSLDGTGTGNVYVLSMSYDGAAPDPTGLNIGYRAGTTGAFTNVGTSSQGSVPWNSGFTTVGQYGVDTTSGTVWVVTDHNSQFVVVPEPAVGLAAAAGCAGIVAGLWRRRRRG
ncbi:MAG: autotransporter-associated beta strand repeat-containing protein [Planctomycetota bacterium]|nr:autotransporter-associated beta strand repeat-containing protein [Planctomycetota bacterium]